MKLRDGMIPVIVGGESGRTNCPTCGMAVRIIRRVDGYADHYEKIQDGEGLDGILRSQDPETAEKLRKLRQGKKTVAFVGLAPTSCTLAPFDDEDVEIWCLNEAHAFKWVKRATRWFQIHATESWKRYLAKRDVRGHADWLKSNPLDVPIYMQYQTDLVPKSVSYPLHEVVAQVFPNFRRGDNKVKYFTSTFAYMAGIIAITGRHPDYMDEKPFERVEIYGFEMADDIEYVQQKSCAEFWIGYLMGIGIEVYTPSNCQILYSALYGGDEQGSGWLKNGL